MRNRKLLLRDLVTAIVVVVPLAILLAVAWATRHPDHPRVRAAHDWPIVGGWVETAAPRPTPLDSPDPTSASRVEYSGLRAWFDAGTEIFEQPNEAASNLKLEVPTRLFVTAQDAGWASVSGHHQGWVRMEGDATKWAEPAVQHRTVWVRPGDQLLRSPGGPVQAVADVISNLPVVATDVEAWVQVIYDDRKLWLQAPEFTGGDPPLGSATTPLMPMAAVDIDAKRMESARLAFTREPITSSAGPYAVVGDSPRVRSLAALCHRRLADADSEFEALTGLAPRGSSRETLLAFSRRDSYRAFLAGAPRVSDHPQMTEPDGYSLPAEGFAATYLEGRSDAEVCSILVHEVVHLVSRRALGPALPPWLAEGLATHLEGGPDSNPDLTVGPALVRMEDEFYAGDLNQRYQTVAAAITTLLTDERFADKTQAFLSDRAAGQPLPGGPGMTAERYWSALVDRVGVSESDLWREIESRR